MASATITTRTLRSGARRFHVRYRLGGRAYPIEHGGSFSTLREARIRRDLLAGELAAGRNPAILLGSLVEKPAVRTFGSWAAAYRQSRVDLGAATARNIGSHLAAMSVFSDRDAATITTTDVTEWIAALQLAPASVSRYLATLRQVLDYAGCDPNPARDARVRLPRVERHVVEPPTAATVEAIIQNTTPRHRLALRTLAETGMRIGELCALVWGDVDEAGSRFRIKAGKTAAARRWVLVPNELMIEITTATPPDDRTMGRRVFGAATPGAVKTAMAKACRNAGIAHYHPHDLRHRYASVQIARGVPVTTVAAQLGHSRNSMTLDTYGHVLIDG